MLGDRPCPSSVKIVEKSVSFHFSIEKDVLPIDSDWLEEQLGLNFEFTEGRAAFPDLAKISNVSGFLLKNVPKVGVLGKDIEYLSKPKSDSRSGDFSFGNTKRRPSHLSVLNGKLILEKSNIVRNTGEIGRSRSSSSSSSSDLDGSPDSKLKSLEREPKSFEVEGEDRSDSPCQGDRLLKDFVSVSFRSQTQAPDSPMHTSVGQVYGALSDTSKGPRQPHIDNQAKLGHDIFNGSDGSMSVLNLEVNNAEGCQSDREGGQWRGPHDGAISVVLNINPSGISTDALPHDSELVSDQGVVDEGDVGEVENDRSMKKIGRKRIHPVKSHGMKTRLSKARALDLKHYIVKEDIVPMVKKASWNLRDEIAKVIKARKVLGFDVEGREKDIVEEIVRRIKAGTFGKKGFCRANN
ncbi:hypothetical protein QYF36_013985 [Acer negundo]|nr:hypothetical protein QYF36_013985 [Acer negundo]